MASLAAQQRRRFHRPMTFSTPISQRFVCGRSCRFQPVRHGAHGEFRLVVGGRWLNECFFIFSFARRQADEAQSLRHLLERELSQDGSRLESHGWYHGPIRRPDAESLLSRDGDFLVRDSSTGGAGDLVLSCYWNGGHLHFLIDKVRPLRLLMSHRPDGPVHNVRMFKRWRLASFIHP